MIGVEFIKDKLPAGFEVLRYAAEREAFHMLDTLAREWASGANRFDKPGEALVAARDGTILVGMGGMTLDPELDGALRMRRFYVIPPYRRRGIGRILARALLERQEVDGHPITLNAPHIEAARFWESLGFVRDARDGHTHVRPAPNATV